MKNAIITFLGTIGRDKEGNFPTAAYSFHHDIIAQENSFQEINTFPLLIKLFGEKYQVVPVYTKEALVKQKEVLSHLNIDFDIEKHGKEISDEDYNEIFETINSLLIDDRYRNVAIDISHGYRHIPVLATVSMIIENFQNTKKIQNILYTKEIEKFKKYEIIDLKGYLDLANISFVLTTFSKNYTVAQHIDSDRYSELTDRLNQLSEDIMALNLNNLFDRSAIKAISALENISKDRAISKQAGQLRDKLRDVFKKEDKRYVTYFKLSDDLFDKNYMLLSLAMLYESIRLYIKTTIKKDQPVLVEKVENFYNNDLYKVGDFFRKLEWRSYEKLDSKKDPSFSKQEYEKLKKAFPNHIRSLLKDIDEKRNNLAHANVQGSFAEIKNEIGDLLDEYRKSCIKDKGTSDSISHFGGM